jgi:hypothetical protein
MAHPERLQGPDPLAGRFPRSANDSLVAELDGSLSVSRT